MGSGTTLDSANPANTDSAKKQHRASVHANSTNCRTANRTRSMH
jgi:hypothetical protein